MIIYILSTVFLKTVRISKLLGNCKNMFCQCHRIRRQGTIIKKIVGKNVKKIVDKKILKRHQKYFSVGSVLHKKIFEFYLKKCTNLISKFYLHSFGHFIDTTATIKTNSAHILSSSHHIYFHVCESIFLISYNSS